MNVECRASSVDDREKHVLKSRVRTESEPDVEAYEKGVVEWMTVGHGQWGSRGEELR